MANKVLSVKEAGIFEEIYIHTLADEGSGNEMSNIMLITKTATL